MDLDHAIFQSKAAKVFSFLDANKDGTLSLDELKKGFEELKIPIATRDELLEEFQVNPNKGITQLEFEKYAEKQYLRVKGLFDKLDTSKDRQISLQELKAGLKEFDSDFESNPSTIKKIFDIVDIDNNGTINFDEWCEFLILMPRLNIKSVLDYWESVMAVCDPNEFTLYGIKGPSQKPVTKDKEDIKGWLSSLGAGFFAGVISRTLTAPFERLKFINQIYYKGAEKPPSLLSGLALLYKQDGFKGLFRGNLVTVLRAGPETSLKLAIFENIKSYFAKNSKKGVGSSELFFAGAVSGVLSTIATFPLSVIRTRLAAAPSGTYNGIFDTVQKMAKSEGAILPFFRGLQPTVLAVVPNSGLNLMAYEYMKDIIIGKDPKTEPSPFTFMGIGGVSAVFSSTLLYPSQIITSRLVMQGLLDKSERKGMMGITKDIYNSSGMTGFFKGYQAAMFKILVGNGLSFGCFEAVKKAMNSKSKGK